VHVCDAVTFSWRAEPALAHVIGDRSEAAYRRGDLFEKRRRMAACCGVAESSALDVLPLHG
jgi:hypothetical protein